LRLYHTLDQPKTNFQCAIGATTLPDKTKTLIYVVDDDASVRKAMEMLLISAGMEVLTFESAETFLENEFREENACLIADIKMKGLSGLELQQKLAEKGIKIPVIFLTAFDSKESREQAKKGGAISFFRKPVDDQALLDSIQWALSLDS
jgi:two-component system response regulator TtrR